MLPAFLARELPFWHFRHGLITHRTVIKRRRTEQEDGHVKRICMVPEKRIGRLPEERNFSPELPTADPDTA